MVERDRTYSRNTRAVALLLSQSIRLARKEKQWTEQELAERAGISRATLQKVEKGDLKVEVGIVLEVAILVGLNLFDGEEQVNRGLSRLNDKLALLPKSVRKPLMEVDDDF